MKRLTLTLLSVTVLASLAVLYSVQLSENVNNQGRKILSDERKRSSEPSSLDITYTVHVMRNFQHEFF